MFETRFKDQVAIVTGGGSGIGQGIAQRLADEGAQVVLFDISPENLEKTSNELKAPNRKIATAVVDVSSEESVKQGLAKVVEQYGRLDVAVNSAGISGPTNVKITDYRVEDFDRIFQINLRGSFLVTKYAITHMLPRNYGRILLIASIAGKEGNPGMVGYSATKAGVIGLVKGVGKEFAETGITVNGLAPAVIGTPMLLNVSPETIKYMTERIPMHRVGSIDEVASLACWIVSPEAGFNTAFTFDLTGGRATY